MSIGYHNVGNTKKDRSTNPKDPLIPLFLNTNKKPQNFILQLTHDEPVGLRVSLPNESIRNQFLENLFKIAESEGIRKEALTKVFQINTADKKGIYIQPSNATESLGAFLSKEGEVSINFGKPSVRDIFLKMSGLFNDDSDFNRCAIEKRPNWKASESELYAFAPAAHNKDESAVYFNPYQLPPPCVILNTQQFGSVQIMSENIAGIGDALTLNFSKKEVCQQFIAFIKEQALLANIPADEISKLFKMHSKIPTRCHITPSTNKFLGCSVSVHDDNDALKLKLGNEIFRDAFFNALSLTKNQAKAKKESIIFVPQVLPPPNIAYDYMIKEPVNLEVAGFHIKPTL